MRAEFDAFKALLVPPGIKIPVYDQSAAELQTSPKPTTYACVYDQTPLQRVARLTGPYASQAFTYAVQHVGKTANEVRDAVERSRALLEGQRLLGATTPLRLIDNSRIRPDDDSKAPKLYSATDVWRCAANTH